MQLRDYLKQRQITMVAFGQLLTPKVSAGKVNHWLRRTRRVSLEEALQIEMLTNGEVTPRELAWPSKSQTNEGVC
ncbi:helix-turn-helix domain-containing protein [Comamonas thiooxydans]|uniref:YdaS family helix-turn-helix protein n=1 Tax=Comamonas thiooxydans TaxID=363952 RepID=UPI002448F14D|nr:YdaS family helix-turn-helix protein [Comamonas thiooxydans]MDH1477398.1 helix-turn-helix domain-containing protein [Comamonas thiooxydans]